MTRKYPLIGGLGIEFPELLMSVFIVLKLTVVIRAVPVTILFSPSQG